MSKKFDGLEHDDYRLQVEIEPKKGYQTKPEETILKIQTLEEYVKEMGVPLMSKRLDAFPLLYDEPPKKLDDVSSQAPELYSTPEVRLYASLLLKTTKDRLKKAQQKTRRAKRKKKRE